MVRKAVDLRGPRYRTVSSDELQRQYRINNATSNHRYGSSYEYPDCSPAQMLNVEPRVVPIL
jgi:hypothetical protein